MSKKREDFPKARGIFIPYDLLNSNSLDELTRAEIKVFMAFYLKRKMLSQNKAQKAGISADTVLNNGEIVFTYTEAKGYGLNQSTFTRALDKLIEVGLIDIAKEPLYPKKPTLFSISNRWKEYGNSGFIKSERRKREKGFGVGKKSRFTK